MKPKVLIFDCDGTVLDTFSLIEAVLKRTFKEILPHVAITLSELHSFFGPFLDESFRKYTNDEEELKRAIARYRELTFELHPEYVRAYPGIPELIRKLKLQGYRLAIVSNKLSEAILYGLQINQLEDAFDLIVGAEMLSSPKPDPDGIYQVLKYFQVQSAFFIGDTKYDIEAGKNANHPPFEVKTVGVTWCRSTEKDFQTWGADYIISSPDQLITILEGYYDL